MTAFWAIVLDTWRQSRQQVVFIIMLVILLITAVLGVALVKPMEAEGEDHVAFAWAEEPAVILEEGWVGVYAQTLLLKQEVTIDGAPRPNESPEEAQDRVMEQMEALAEAAEAQTDLGPRRRGAEVWLMGIAGAIFTLSMLLFLGASAGYYPAMLESGAIDVVLSKPIDRLKIFLGKFVGGLALYAAAVAATYLLLFLGLGIRLGEWMPRVFLVLPLQVFSAAVLFAMMAALGVFSRSSTLCLIVGLVYYIVVDTAIGSLIAVQQLFQLQGQGGEGGWLGWIAEAARLGLPNFGLLKQQANFSVLNMPAMEWGPILTAAVWLVVMLAAGYWKFQRSDY